MYIQNNVLLYLISVGNDYLYIKYCFLVYLIMLKRVFLSRNKVESCTKAL